MGGVIVNGATPHAEPSCWNSEYNTNVALFMFAGAGRLLVVHALFPWTDLS